MLNLLLGYFWAKARAVCYRVIVAGQSTIVVKENIEPERHFIAIMLCGPVVSLLQRCDK